MKLRYKKTGKLATFIKLEKGNIIPLLLTIIDENDVQLTLRYSSLAELNEEWEDYTPRIEDDKVRKIVKQWLMVSLDNHMNISFDKYMNGFYLYEENSDRSVAGITFPDNIKFNLEHDKDYTFAELCGEEE